MACSCCHNEEEKNSCSSEEEEEEEEKQEKRIHIILLIWGSLCLISGFIFQKVDTQFLEHSWENFSQNNYFTSFSFVSFLLYSIGYLPLLINHIKGMIEEWKEGNLFNENLLVVIATLGAYGINQYVESLFVILFAIVGEMLEDYAVAKSKRSIVKLVNSMPLYAHYLDSENKIIEKTPEELKIGDRIEIRPGEKIPVDGKIVKGASSLDTSSITGESLPKDVKEGDVLYSGCINNDSVIILEVTKEYEDSTLTKILTLVQTQQNKKTKTEKLINRFAKIYTPIVLVSVILVFLLGFYFSSWSWANGGKEWLYRALSMLLIACPCSLIIAVPIAFFAGLGTASKHGILVKGSQALETLAKSDVILFDKTGTLTTGHFALLNNVDESYLKIAASLESKSTHPIASAITSAYKNELENVESFKNIPGFGIKGVIRGKTYYLGSKEFLKQNHVDSVKEEKTPYKVLYLANEKVFLQAFVIADQAKENAKDQMRYLKQEGYRETIMLSGDEETIAKTISENLGLDSYKGNLLPEEKLSLVKEYSSNHITTYVGDGINDSPSLLASHVSIAMGDIGADAAIQAADIVINKDKLEQISEIKRLSKKTYFIAKLVIFLSIALKFLFMALVLSGVLGQNAMLISGISDTGVMVLCVLIACTLLFYKPKYIIKKS